MNEEKKKERMIRFSHRDVVFLAISFRSLSLDIDNYTLEIKNYVTDEQIKSNPTELTIVKYNILFYFFIYLDTKISIRFFA
jgi:hypothetical protein